MVGKSILTFFILVGLYSIIANLDRNNKFVALNQNQGNKVSLQEFVYASEDEYETIILGSSMAYRMKSFMLPKSYYNLALGGSSSILGSEILVRKKTKKKKILIETNMIFREVSGAMIKDLFSEPSYSIKKNVLISRDRFKIVPFLVSKGSSLMELNKKVNRNYTLDSSRFQKILESQKSTFNTLPNHSKIEKCIKNLKENIDILIESNNCIAFFEMPMHDALCNTTLMNEIRQQISSTFPQSEYPYFFIDDCFNYTTTDGVHLIPNDAEKMSTLIAEFGDSILCSKN